MVHFYVDDGLHGNQKARTVSPAAMGLWLLAGSQSADALTEGLVPLWFVRSIPSGVRLARELVEVRVPNSQYGLWHGVGESCTSEKCPAALAPVPSDHFAFHDWAKVNTKTKAVVEADRAANAARQKRFKERHMSGESNGVSTDTQSSPVHTDGLDDKKGRPSTRVHNGDKPVENVTDQAAAFLSSIAGEAVSLLQASTAVDLILERGGKRVRNPTRYVMGTLRDHGPEWVAYIFEGKEPE